jgi:hypothetical protein
MHLHDFPASDVKAWRHYGGRQYTSLNYESCMTTKFPGLLITMEISLVQGNNSMRCTAEASLATMQ